MKYRYVDFMRGIAILMVIIVHSSFLIQSNNIFNYLASFGQFGVQLFFVASALTLCLSMEKRGCHKKEITAFYLRRIFRIAPMYYIGILVYAALNYYLNIHNLKNTFEDYTIGAILSNMFFIHGFVPGANNTIVPGGWSIGTEMFFYVLFPFLFLALRNLKQRRLLLINLLYTVFVVVLFLLYNDQLRLENNSFLYYNFFNQIPLFLWGITLFEFIKNQRKVSILHILLVPVAFFAINFLWNSQFVFSFHLILFIVGYVFYALGTILYKFSIHNKIIDEIGKKSFSIYILHFLLCWYIFPVLMSYLPSYILSEKILLLFITFLFTVVGSYLLASFTYFAVEKYFINLGNFIIKKYSFFHY